MKQIIYLQVLTLMFTIASIKAFSQTTLHVSSGANFYVTSNTYVYIDGLQVKPSIDYNITGENRVTRDATATPSPPRPYIQRVYHLLQTLPPYSGDITIYYQDSELNGLAENTLNLNVYNGSTWNDYGATTRDAANNYVARTGLSNIAINQATLASPGAALPVTLSSFTIQNNSCTALLKWTTASEQNSKHFDVQHSTDGITFFTKALVTASGNSNVEKQYSFTTRLSDGNNYFRLRMVDRDGSTKFSPVVSVTTNCNSNVLAIYPNPAKDKLYITGLTNYSRFQISDANGRIMLQQNFLPGMQYVNVNQLAKGVYVFTVIGDSDSKSLRFIKN